MKILFWSFLLIFCLTFDICAQEANRKHSILFHTGIVLDDGFVYRKTVPTLGLGYSYKLL